MAQGVGGQWCYGRGQTAPAIPVARPVSNAAPTSYAKHYATAESEKKLPSFFYLFCSGLIIAKDLNFLIWIYMIS